MLDLTEKTLTERLKDAHKPIVLYGMGNGADHIISEMESHGISISGVFVSDGFVRDKVFHGHKLYSYADMKSRFAEMIVLVAFGSSLPDVITNIKRIATEQELYAPYVPVIGGGTFSRDYVTFNSEKFKKIYSELNDSLSKLTYKNILNYRYSGKIDYLTECETSTDELYKLLKLSNDMVYVDCGAYTGDTVCEFIAYAEKFKFIHAIEPDIKTFKKLIRNTEGIENIKLYNAAAYSHSNGTTFSMRSGRNSSISELGIDTASVSIDDILSGGRADYIKMDIEGAELYAIDGARFTISNFKPKMLISCYHRIDDLFSIPEKVLSIRPDYEMYIRHRPYVPDWDTEFIFV